MNPVVLLAAALTVAAPALKEKPKPEAASVVGEWQVESTSVNGRKAVVANNLTYTFTKEGKWLIHRDGQELSPTLDRRVEYDAKPARPTIDLVSSAANPATRLQGIYKVEGDTLTICGTRGKAERPTSFDNPEGSGVTTYVLRRVKK